MIEAQPQGSHSFSHYLMHRSAAEGPATKGERTRDRIAAAAADLLADDGFHQLRMADIANKAGISTASIYQYFENKTQITLEVMTEFLQRCEEVLLSSPLGKDPYREIYQVNLLYVLFFRENAGIMRCLRVLSDEIPEVGNLTTETYTKWRRRLARNLMGWSGADETKEASVNITAHALMVMGREFLYDLYVRDIPDLVRLRDSPEEVAEFFSAHWYRAATGEELLKCPEPPDRGAQ